MATLTRRGHFDSDTETIGVIGRVYFEGDHPDYGACTVLLLLIPHTDREGIRGTCFMRVFSAPGMFEIGAQVIFQGLDATYIRSNWQKIPLERAGATFIEYPDHGKIMEGG